MFNMKNGRVPIYFAVFGQPLWSLLKVSFLVNSQNKFFYTELKDPKRLGLAQERFWPKVAY